MDKDYLVDTNILIYYFADAIPKKELNRIEQLFMTSFNISIITKKNIILKERYKCIKWLLEYAAKKGFDIQDRRLRILAGVNI